MTLTGDQLRAEMARVMDIANTLDRAIGQESIMHARTPARLADAIAAIQAAAAQAYAQVTQIVADRP